MLKQNPNLVSIIIMTKSDNYTFSVAPSSFILLNTHVTKPLPTWASPSLVVLPRHSLACPSVRSTPPSQQ